MLYTTRYVNRLFQETLVNNFMHNLTYKCDPFTFLIISIMSILSLHYVYISLIWKVTQLLSRRCEHLSPKPSHSFPGYSHSCPPSSSLGGNLDVLCVTNATFLNKGRGLRVRVNQSESRSAAHS